MEWFFNVYRSLASATPTVMLTIFAVVMVLTFCWIIIFSAGPIVRYIVLIASQAGALVLAYRSGDTWSVYFALFFLPPFLLGLFSFWLYSNPIKKGKFIVEMETMNGKMGVDMRQHASVFGATGAGKTDSIFVQMIRHLFKYRLSSVIFDYKDFELWEKVLYFEEEQRKKNIRLAASGKPIVPLQPTHCIYLNDPNLSVFVNFISPELINRMEDAETVAGTLFDNLYPGDNPGDGNFFKDTASGAFAGTLWRFKEDFPQYCSFPYVCAMIIEANADQLIAFISENNKAKILAAPFVDSQGNRKQLASVKSSITAAIKKLCTPNLFMIFSKSEIDISVNKPGNEMILGLVNTPSYDSVYLPLYATISRLIMDKCCERDRDYSLWILDEGSVLKMRLLYRVLATLRTFKVLVAWGLQDKVQGEILYNQRELKAITANMGMQFMGKANDPESAEYYTKLFETVDVEERSYSTGDGRSSITKSTREKKKYKNIEFRRLLPGEFFTVDQQGKDRKLRFRAIAYTPVKPKKVHSLSRAEVEHHFDMVFNTVKGMVGNIIVPVPEDEPGFKDL
jgi:type IV secretory pathway TraG/TraD family ATPase VirD4